MMMPDVKQAKEWLNALPSAKDISSRFAPYKDVNDYLVKKK